MHAYSTVQHTRHRHAYSQALVQHCTVLYQVPPREQPSLGTGLYSTIPDTATRTTNPWYSTVQYYTRHHYAYNQSLAQHCTVLYEAPPCTQQNCTALYQAPPCMHAFRTVQRYTGHRHARQHHCTALYQASPCSPTSLYSTIPGIAMLAYITVQHYTRHRHARLHHCTALYQASPCSPTSLYMHIEIKMH